MAQTSIQSLEKIAKTSEDTKKLLGKLTKLNSQIGKKDETQATKLSSLVKKVADSSFTPTFLQKFLQKPDEEEELQPPQITDDMDIDFDDDYDISKW